MKEYFWETDFNVNLAEAMPNGLIKEEYELYCFLNDIQQNNTTLHLFLNEQLRAIERAKVSHTKSSRSFIYLVSFVSKFGEHLQIEEPKESEAKKLFSCLKAKLDTQMFKKYKDGSLERIA